MPSIDLTHLQALAAAGEATSDADLQAEIEALLGRVLTADTNVVVNRYDFFATTRVVVDLGMDSLAPCPAPRFVLEPSAGSGVWLEAVAERWPDAILHAVERNPVNRLALGQRWPGALVGSDFLTFRPTVRYDLIVGNPPFSDASNKLAWVAHIKHAMTLLAPRGQLMMVAPSGLTFAGQKAVEELRAVVRTHPLPRDAFKASGTSVQTVLCWYSPDPTLTPRWPAIEEALSDDDLEDPDVILDQIMDNMAEAWGHLRALKAMLNEGRSTLRQAKLFEET